MFVCCLILLFLTEPVLQPTVSTQILGPDDYECGCGKGPGDNEVVTHLIDIMDLPLFTRVSFIPITGRWVVRPVEVGRGRLLLLQLSR